MTLPPLGQVRFACIPHAGFWRVEARDGANWSVGNLSVDLAEAIHSAQEKFAAEHGPKLQPKTSSTDLSDLFI